MQINYSFKNQSLLTQALTHPSTCKSKNRVTSSYERLELLGDKVLGLAISELLFKKFPNANEGQISIMLSKLVSTDTVSKIAKEIGIADAIIMDKGEEMGGGRSNRRNLENAMEALIGAIFLDSSYLEAKDIVSQLWGPSLAKADFESKDAKSLLQEWAQKRGKPIPKYHILNEEGESHAPTFTVEVEVQGFSKCNASASSKKEAERRAARKLLNIINKQ